MSRGTPTRILRMAEALALRGHDVHVATYHLGDDFPTKPPFTVHRIRNFDSYRKTSPGPALSKLLLLDPALASTVSEVVRDHRIDIIHAHHFEGLAVSWPAARRHRIPLIYDAHTTLSSELHYYRLGLPQGAKRLAGSVVDRFAPRLADHVVAVSAEIRAALIEKSRVPDEQISVIPNGVEAEHFDLPEGRDAAQDPNLIVYAGNLAPFQGIDLLIRSFRRILDMRPMTRLMLATEDRFDRYEEIAQTLGVRDRIDVLHTLFADLPARLARATVALNPRIEGAGLPQKLLNYMAASRPIVSFQGSARHLVNGQHARIVANGDIEGFAGAVVGLLDDDQTARRMGDNGRILVQKHFAWDQVAEQLEGLYPRLIKPRHIEAPSVRMSPAATDTRPAAIVVNYNGGERIANTIRALSSASASPSRIILVDNASTDGSREQVCAEFPDVELLAMDTNIGLAAARNAGLRHVGPGPVLLVDGDVYVTDRCIEILWRAMRQAAATVACPRVVFHPDLDLVQCDGAAAHFVGTMSLRHANLPLASRAAFEMQPCPVQVGACIGACMLVDRDAVLDAGGFDERYVFYFEDLEFSLRMRALGHTILCVPEAVVHHDRGRGTPGLSYRGQGTYPHRRAYLTMRHRLLTMITHYRLRTLLILAPALLLYEAATFVFVLKNGWARPWMDAWLWQARNFAGIRRQRRIMQARRLVPDRVLLSGGALPLAQGVAEQRVVSAAVAALSFCLNLYWRLVRRLLG
ncbi:glycosyltransferase [Falsiroseomonas sp. HC035]|uniref:glycosyltransferase n=1 Tax=Falsiroseomonas sp. HC035 TaxID=3390999 RepID=UPI003D319159